MQRRSLDTSVVPKSPYDDLLEPKQRFKLNKRLENNRSKMSLLESKLRSVSEIDTPEIQEELDAMAEDRQVFDYVVSTLE